MALHGVIFDCDGTLLDSTEVWIETQNALTAKAHAELSSDDLAALWTYTIPEMANFYHERFNLGNSSEDVIAMVYEQMLESYRVKIKPREGALDFVKQLRAAGVICSVASSTPPTLLQVALEVAGFTPYLAAIVSVDDAGKSKREPDVYDLALARMGTQKACTWVFEDSVYAVATAKNAGYQVVGIYDSDTAGTWEELKIADIRIREFEDLNIHEFIYGAQQNIYEARNAEQPRYGEPPTPPLGYNPQPDTQAYRQQGYSPQDQTGSDYPISYDNSQTNTGLTSLVCGIFAIALSPSVIFGIGLGIAAIVTSVVSLRATKSAGVPPDSKAMGGRVCGIIGLVISGLILVSSMLLLVRVAAFLGTAL